MFYIRDTNREIIMVNVHNPLFLRNSIFTCSFCFTIFLAVLGGFLIDELVIENKFFGFKGVAEQVDASFDVSRVIFSHVYVAIVSVMVIAEYLVYDVWGMKDSDYAFKDRLKKFEKVTPEELDDFFEYIRRFRYRRLKVAFAIYFVAWIFVGSPAHVFIACHIIHTIAGYIYMFKHSGLKFPKLINEHMRMVHSNEVGPFESSKD